MPTRIVAVITMSSIGWVCGPVWRSAERLRFQA